MTLILTIFKVRYVYLPLNSHNKIPSFFKIILCWPMTNNLFNSIITPDFMPQKNSNVYFVPFVDSKVLTYNHHLSSGSSYTDDPGLREHGS